MVCTCCRISYSFEDIMRCILLGLMADSMFGGVNGSLMSVLCYASSFIFSII